MEMKPMSIIINYQMILFIINKKQILLILKNCIVEKEKIYQ